MLHARSIMTATSSMSAIDRKRCASLQLRALAHQTLHELFSHSLIRLLYFFTAATGQSGQQPASDRCGLSDSRCLVLGYLDAVQKCAISNTSKSASQTFWWLVIARELF
jgi:hypothetical protein